MVIGFISADNDRPRVTVAPELEVTVVRTDSLLITETLSSFAAAAAIAAAIAALVAAIAAGFVVLFVRDRPPPTVDNPLPADAPTVFTEFEARVGGAERSSMVDTTRRAPLYDDRNADAELKSQSLLFIIDETVVGRASPQPLLMGEEDTKG